MIIANGALQLVTGSPANGGIIIIPEQFKAAALAAAEKVRRGLCKKIDESDELSANHPIARHIVSILYCHWSHQSVILFIFANTTRN